MAGNDENWNRFLDEIIMADIEHEDLQRIIKSMDDEGIDRFDSEKVMTDLCSLRHRFGFLYLAVQACAYICRPKSCLHKSVRDIGKAIGILRFLKSAMADIQEELDDEEDDDEEKETGEEAGEDSQEAGEDREGETDKADPD